MVTGGTALATQGATLPYTEYVADAQTTNGSVLAASRTYPSIAAEATGRSAVQLTSTGQYVQFTLTKPANSAGRPLLDPRQRRRHRSRPRRSSLYAGTTRSRTSP